MHFTPTVESLPSVVPFVGPETQERARGRKFRARIGANESVFGPSPRAVAAMQRAATEVWKYCDPENHDLKQALAAHHGVGPQNIVVGEGIARANGLKPLPSAANYVTIDCCNDGAFARRVLSELIARDVFARMPGVSPLDRCIRVSAGLPSDLDAFEEALPQALSAAAGLRP
jgi:histidinol-phosphate/aromatic aminotransferase/cobyric acid decarboxylase-like protein